ncbi:MAG: ABC transporter ATP-binding protein [Zestosphaera sp.]
MELEVRDLSVLIGGLQILRKLNLAISSGVTAVIGPNGAGKTTLLKAISGLISFQGVVKLFGRDIASLSRAEVARLVTYVPPVIDALPDVTVGDLILSDYMVDRGLLNHYVSLLKLGPLLARRVGLVSSGELSRALLARGLSRDSRAIALDEPLSHIDIRFQLTLLEHLKVLGGEGRVVLIASNQLSPLLNHVDHVLVLNNGEAVFTGSTADLLKTKILDDVYGVEFEVITGNGFVDLLPKKPLQ